MNARKTTAGPLRKVRKPVLSLTRGKGKTSAESLADIVAEGIGANACAAWDWSRVPFGDPEERIDLTQLMVSTTEAGQAVNRGDLNGPESVLVAQATVLNAVFVDLLYRAKNTKLQDHFNDYLKLAFRAQSQCRSTYEALAVLKNPPIFARQANIAGQQIVNNGGMVSPSRARDTSNAPNGLLEAHVERLDSGAARSTGGRDQAVAPLGALDRTADSGGKEAVVSKRLPRRPSSHSTEVGRAPTADGRRGSQSPLVTDGGSKDPK